MTDIVEPFYPCATQKCKERCEIDDVCHSEEICLEEIASIRQQLAECQEVAASSQAREKVLRDALELSWSEQYVNGIIARSKARDALTLPFDSTALDTMLKAVIDNEHQNPWKSAVIDGLVVAHILTHEHEADPRKALNDLICWSNDVALDPSVSSDASNLKKQWQREALLEAAEWFESIVAGQYDGRAAGWNIRRMAKELE